MPRQTLGRGLSALLGDEAPTEGVLSTPSNSSEIDIDLIDPNPEQPRKRFTDTHLEELATSIRVNGIVQPIVVRRAGTRYQIVAGERRWRAAQRAELRRVPIVVKNVTDEKLLELALVENIQRQELNPIEEAKAYRKLIDNIGLTQEMVADRVGKERSVVTTSLRLLRLPDDIQEMVEAGRLSAGHGRALLMSDDPKIQRSVARSAIEGGWSVRATEKVLKRGGRDAASERPAKAPDANIKAAETKLMRALNTNVKIHPAARGTGGRIEIEFYSVDDLHRIYGQIINK